MHSPFVPNKFLQFQDHIQYNFPCFFANLVGKTLFSINHFLYHIPGVWGTEGHPWRLWWCWWPGCSWRCWSTGDRVYLCRRGGNVCQGLVRCRGQQGQLTEPQEYSGSDMHHLGLGLGKLNPAERYGRHWKDFSDSFSSADSSDRAEQFMLTNGWEHEYGNQINTQLCDLDRVT